MRWSIEDFVYGGTDGAITTFAVVSGAFGASLSISVILILGFANLLADGFSMSIGNYLSRRTNKEYIEKERRKEEWSIDNLTKEEKEEIREIYKNKGLKGDLLEDIVEVITSKRKVWIDTMMREELGLVDDKKEPKDTALTTFIAFNLLGLIPLSPFVIIHIIGISIISSNYAFILSSIFTAISFFLIGIIKGKIVKKSWIKSGLHTLGIGGIASTVAYIVGYILSIYVK
ncbi:MAG TPA: VIT1/CCC1 transporter family protein [Nitrososphaeraceae archaeon]|nr:VIT1/CCC1 transporter family protein [Nitrososphaeraceae archaeon]